MKAYSVVLNLSGKVGPIPEGMDSTAALRNLELSARHEEIKKNVSRPGSHLPGKAGLQAPLLGAGPHGQQGPDRALIQ